MNNKPELSKEEVESLNKMMENAERVEVSEETFNRLMDAINEPSNPSPELIELMSRKPRYTKR